jgi:hypothetical protein
MSANERAALRASVEDAFVSLYAIDPASLTGAQRQQHQAQLTTVYLSLLALENADFEALTEPVAAQLAELAERTQQVQAELAGLKRAEVVLGVIDAALAVFAKITKLLS